MPKTLTPQPTAAAIVAGGFVISTGQAADMTGNRGTKTQLAQDSTTAPKPGDRRADTTGRETRIVKALAEARRMRHHRDCHCRRFDGQYCNAMDALWTRATNRELDQMRTDQ